MAEDKYEFTTVENQTLRDLSKKMKGVAIFLFIFGGITGFSGIQTLVMGGNYFGIMLMAVIYILMAVWTIKASNAFTDVVRTEGHDIAHLMRALVSLLSLYSLQFWLLILAIVVIGLALFVGGGTASGAGPAV